MSASSATVNDFEDDRRVSLLDVVTQEYEEERHRRTARLLLTATFEPTKHRETEITQWFNDFVAAHQVPGSTHAHAPASADGATSSASAPVSLQENPDAVTGILLLVNTSALASVIEAPADVLRALILSLANIAASGAPFLTAVKVSAFSEEVPREFPTWAARATKAAVDEFTGAANMTKVVFDVYRHILELGRDCAAQPPEKQIEYLEKSQARQFINHVPTAEKIAAFGACDEIPTPAEWVAIFETPIDLTLDSDVTWPAEPWLKY